MIEIPKKYKKEIFARFNMKNAEWIKETQVYKINGVVCCV